MLKNRLSVMARLTALVGKLIPVLLVAIALGSLGYLSASFILIFSGQALLRAIGIDGGSVAALCTAIILCAATRGLLRYFEQLSGHYMAFKLLATLRDKVFSVLRTLAPAKLEQQAQGELVSTVTNDIELLEVFYAHTLAPLAIAVIVSVVMILYIGTQHVALGIIAALAYLCVGALIPSLNYKARSSAGNDYKEKFCLANSYLLESLYGLPETLRFGRSKDRQAQIDKISDDMEVEQSKLKQFEGKNAALTDALVLLFSAAVLFTGLYLFQSGSIRFSQVLIATIAIMSSFGPVVALSNLSNDLTHTIAAGERVLSLLAEEPETPEVSTGLTVNYQDVRCENISFSYNGEQILHGLNLHIPKTGITGIHGESGSGKTMLLKLMMRFWDVQKGRISLSGQEIRRINTKCLRDMEGYLTQEAFLFEGTLLDNIRLSKPDAAIEEVEQAARDADIHDFISRLPNGYQTRLGELGDGLSAGQRQRIGLARAFLHGAPLLLLDEPTSNLDSLSEAVILKSLKRASAEKSIVLVSHRASTLRISDKIYHVKRGLLQQD